MVFRVHIPAHSLHVCRQAPTVARQVTTEVDTHCVYASVTPKSYGARSVSWPGGRNRESCQKPNGVAFTSHNQKQPGGWGLSPAAPAPNWQKTATPSAGTDPRALGQKNLRKDGAQLLFNLRRTHPAH